MFQVQNYVLASSLEEAYTLNQKKTARVLGGMIWMKMSHANYQTVIDLSALGLDQIEEKEEEFVIGAMVSLHQMETDLALESYYHGALRESVRHIVGVQLRNCATVGGSIFGRFGFSDVLTCMLALNAQVELYHAGMMSLEEFCEKKRDNDILVAIHLPKTDAQIVYRSVRNTKTDFPTLTTAVSHCQGQWRIAVGARPSRAKVCVVHTAPGEVPEAEKIASAYEYGSNMRGSAAYRLHLAKVLIRRCIEQIQETETRI